MTNEIENLIKKIALKDVKIALISAQINKIIIPDEVFNILKEVEKTYE